MNNDAAHLDQVPEDSELAPAELKAARELSAQIRPDEYNSVTEFGSGIQQEISEFAGHLLGRVKSRDSDSIGATVTELMLKIKGVDVKKLGEPASGLAKIPWIGNWFDQVKKLKSQYEKLETQIDFIQTSLTEASSNCRKIPKCSICSCKKITAILKTLKFISQRYGCGWMN